MNFTHLHVHSEYSLLDGSAKINEIITRTKELGMDSIALTDHGVMYGVIDFYKQALAAGIKPILGCEVYVAEQSRFDKNGSKETNSYHMVLLAENNEGYQNLMKLVSYGFTEGFYYRPRIDHELLRKYHKGLIALSACLGGVIPKRLTTKSYDAAKEAAMEYNDIFGQGNFYLEIQDHGIPAQKEVNQKLIRISEETGIPLVATNDSHYVTREDNQAHDILLCIQTAKTVDDPTRMRYQGEEFFIKSPSEMRALFPYAKEALENTTHIAQRCHVDIKFHEPKLPKFKLKPGADAGEYLKTLCLKGLENRYGYLAQESAAYKNLEDRLAYELETITSMGFVDYFLIVWDFIRYAKENNIAVGPGRGSAAGSLASYCLQITDIDPIKYNLLFERFLNPERISMPDIDIDFCYERRQEVIDYVVDKYGEDHVAQIITFGTMSARLVLRDVGRAMAMPYGDVDKIAKMIPFQIGITIKQALTLNKELATLYEQDTQVKSLIDMSRKLEGLPRHASTHAAGVVICENPVMEYVPLNTNDGAVTTQFPMNTLEELGLLKMDFLGLRTLTIIDKTIEEIKHSQNKDIILDQIDFTIPAVYEMIAAAKTEGVFQLESDGMKSFMKELKPACLEDIIAGIALYRPGPMEFIPKYVKGKRNASKVTYTHESLKPILESTYGCIVYQEQVMQIVRDLAGYSLGRSDLVRRAMSKKKTDVMEEERKNFVYGIPGEVPGCVHNGIPAETAEKIFDEMIDFAKYAFNKSHAAAYAIISYQTAWLKLYYPIEFMAALMTSVMDHTTKLIEYIDACKKMDIKIMPPDINKGRSGFSVSGGNIVFGLSAIKNVGKGIIEDIVQERNQHGLFSSFSEFCHRLSNQDINKRCLESLIKAGAFDSLGGKRSQYMAVYKQITDGIAGVKKRTIEGQISLFDMGTQEEDTPKAQDNLPNIAEYEADLLLSLEKEVLGIYLSGHPLSKYEAILRRKTSSTSLDFLYNEEQTGPNPLDGKKVCVGGIIMSKSVKYTKNNQTMAFISLEDLYGTIEIIIFPNIYDKSSHLLENEKAVIIQGRASFSEEEDGKIVAEQILPLDPEDSPQPQAAQSMVLWLKINENKPAYIYDGLTFILEAYRGNTPVIVYQEATKEKIRMQRTHWVDLADGLMEDLSELLGDGCVVAKEYQPKGKST